MADIYRIMVNPPGVPVEFSLQMKCGGYNRADVRLNDARVQNAIFHTIIRNINILRKKYCL
jgi:hypothetical protein